MHYFDLNCQLIPASTYLIKNTFIFFILDTYTYQSHFILCILNKFYNLFCTLNNKKKWHI